MGSRGGRDAAGGASCGPHDEHGARRLDEYWQRELIPRQGRRRDRVFNEFVLKSTHGMRSGATEEELLTGQGASGTEETKAGGSRRERQRNKVPPLPEPV